MTTKKSTNAIISGPPGSGKTGQALSVGGYRVLFGRLPARSVEISDRFGISPPKTVKCADVEALVAQMQVYRKRAPKLIEKYGFVVYIFDDLNHIFNAYADQIEQGAGLLHGWKGVKSAFNEMVDEFVELFRIPGLFVVATMHLRGARVSKSQGFIRSTPTFPSDLGDKFVSFFSNALSLSLPQQSGTGFGEWASIVRTVGTSEVSAKVRVRGFRDGSPFALWPNLREAGFTIPYPEEVAWMEEAIPAALQAGFDAAADADDVEGAWAAGGKSLKAAVPAGTPVEHIEWAIAAFKVRISLRILTKRDPFADLF